MYRGYVPCWKVGVNCAMNWRKDVF